MTSNVVSVIVEQMFLVILVRSLIYSTLVVVLSCEMNDYYYFLIKIIPTINK